MATPGEPAAVSRNEPASAPKEDHAAGQQPLGSAPVSGADAYAPPTQPRKRSSSKASAGPEAGASGSGASSPGTGPTPGAGTPKLASGKAPPDPEDLMVKLREYIQELGGTLGEGWKATAKPRTQGITAGKQYDVYYHAPDGKRYRSRTEVARRFDLDVPETATVRASKAAAEAAAVAAGLTPAEAHARAVAKAADVGATLPLALPNGVTVLQLGTIRAEPGYHTRTQLWPAGFLSTWQPLQGGSVTSAGRPARAAAATAAPAVPVVFVSMIVQDGGAKGGAPSFTVAAGRDVDLRQSAQELRARVLAAGSQPEAGDLLVAASAASPDEAWTQVASLQREALAALGPEEEEAVSEGGEEEEEEQEEEAAKKQRAGGAASKAALEPVQQLLVEVPPLKQPWGLQLFGLTDAAVLMCIEALPGAETCAAYRFAEQRGGWDAVLVLLEEERPGSRKRRAQERAAAAGALDGGGKRARLDPGQMTLDSLWSQKVAEEADEFAGQGYDRHDAAHITGQVSKVMEAMLGRMTLAAARAPGAYRGPASASGAGGSGGGGLPKGFKQTAKAAEKLLKKFEREEEKKRREEEKALGIKRPRGAGTAALQKPEIGANGKVVGPGPYDDALLPGASLPPPPPEPLGLLPGAPLSDHPAHAQELLAAYGFLARFCHLLRLEAVPTSAAHLQRMLLAGSASSSSSSSAAADWAACHALHSSLVSALVGDLWTELATQHIIDTSTLQLRELVGTGPQATLHTWPEVARRYMLGAAAAAYLDLSEPKSASIQKMKLAEPLQVLEPDDWIHYLLAGVNFPDLVSPIALLPKSSSEFAADALTSYDDARALAASERLLHRMPHGIAAAAAAAEAAVVPKSPLQQQKAIDMEVDGVAAKTGGANGEEDGAGGDDDKGKAKEVAAVVLSAPAIQPSSLSALQQLRLGRRVLARVYEEGIFNRGQRSLEAQTRRAEQFSFFAPEFSKILKAPRGLDLHLVAARLDTGFYQATGNVVAALAADVREACALWRATFQQVPERVPICGDRFKAAPPELCAGVERALDAVLATELQGLIREVVDSGPAEHVRDSDPGGSASASAAAAAGCSSASAQIAAALRRQAAEDAGEQRDRYARDEPARLFAPIAGCRVCWKDVDPGRELMCDGCDDEYHCYCVQPPLLAVPEGDWYCPSCMSANRGQANAVIASPLPARRLAAAVGPSSSRLAAAAAAAAPFASTVAGAAAGTALQPRPPAAAGPGGAAAGAAAEGKISVDITSFQAEHLRERMTVRSDAMDAVRQLLGAAQLLGQVDYADATPHQRLTVLGHLIELTLNGNLLRKYLNDTVEAQREAKKEANEIRAAATKAVKEAKADTKEAAKGGKEAKAGGSGKEANGDAAGAGKGAGAKGGKGAGKGGGGGSQAAKATRSHGPVAASGEVDHARIQALEAQIEASPIKGRFLGYDRHWNRYWALLATTTGAAPLSNGKGGAKGASAAGSAHTAGILVEQLPKGVPQAEVTTLEGLATPAGTRFGTYTSAQAVGALCDYLHRQGAREGPLRAGALRIRDQLAALAQQQQQPSGSAAAAAASDSPAVAAAVDDAMKEDGAEAAPAAATTTPASPAEALRQELLTLYQTLPEEAFRLPWGSPERQAAWVDLAQNAATPGEATAAIVLLEHMLSDLCFKPIWRLWAAPAQHPGCVNTWHGAWYRLQALQTGLKSKVAAGKEVPVAPGAARGKLRSAAPAAAAPTTKEHRKERYAARHGSAGSLQALEAAAAAEAASEEEEAEVEAGGAAGRKRKAADKAGSGGGEGSEGAAPAPAEVAEQPRLKVRLTRSALAPPAVPLPPGSGRAAAAAGQQKRRAVMADADEPVD